MKTSLYALALLASAASAFPALAQTNAAPFTAGLRYDVQRRLTGTISPDPDGSGPRSHRAVRNTYDAAGRLTKVEKGELALWQSEMVAPSSWTGFTILQIVDTAYDPLDRKVKESLSGVPSAGGAMAVQSVTETSYDLAGRLKCTAVRMNPNEFALPPRDACLQGTPHGTYGADRITRSDYDEAGQLVQSREGVGTSIEAVEATRNYTPNGQLKNLIDANGNRSEMRYDGFDRLHCWILPSLSRPSAFNPATQATALASAGAIGGDCASSGDFELYEYDPSGNRTRLRNREGQVLNSSFDALNRMTLKDRPAAEPDVAYSYDLRGLQLSASFPSTGESVNHTYDGFGRIATSQSTMGGLGTTLTSSYDADGNRIGLNWGDGFILAYDWLATGEMSFVGENSWTGSAVLGSFAYDALGRRIGLGRSSVGQTSYGYDRGSGLVSLGHYFAGNGNDLAYAMERNPAGQILSRTGAHNFYMLTPAANGTAPSIIDGLNRIVVHGSYGYGYDWKGNLAWDGTTAYTYDSENRLITAAGARNATLTYDPLGRLFQVSGPGGTTRFLYDGDDLIAELNGSNQLLRRYVHGPGADEPLALYEGTWTTARRWLFADERGSIVGMFDINGWGIGYRAYDEYGVTQTTWGDAGRFGYTGQAWIPELGAYYYKARMYSPGLGRFLQVDPVGYKDQINLYAYVADDPVNRTDSSGEGDIYPHQKPEADPFGDMVDFFVGDIIRAVRQPSVRNIAIAGIGVLPVGRIAVWGERVAARLVSRIGARSAVLSRRNFSAAVREARGEVVARKADGTSFDHLAKVQQAAQGLRNDLRRSEALLASGKLAPADAARLRQSVTAGQQRLNDAEAALRRAKEELERR